MLFGMVVVECPKRPQQINHPTVDGFQPRRELWQCRTALLETALLKWRVVSHDGAGAGGGIPQLEHELRSGIVTVFGQKHDMFRLGSRRTDDMQTELKRHLLVRMKPVKQRNRRATCLEVQVAHRVFELSEKLGDGLLVDLRLSAHSAPRG